MIEFKKNQGAGRKASNFENLLSHKYDTTILDDDDDLSKDYKKRRGTVRRSQKIQKFKTQR